MPLEQRKAKPRRPTASRSLPAGRRARGTTPGSTSSTTERARLAWVAVAQLREAVQARIVAGFRAQIEGAGEGPADAELRLFARVAVIEMRLRRAFGDAQAQRIFISAPSPVPSTPLTRRGDRP